METQTEIYGGHISNTLPSMDVLHAIREQHSRVAAVSQMFERVTRELMAARALGRDTEEFFQQLEVLVAVKARETSALGELMATVGQP